MLRASVEAPPPSMLRVDMTPSAADCLSTRQSHSSVDNVASRHFPFAIQHLLGIDRHHHHHHQQQQRHPHHDVTALSQRHQQQQHSPVTLATGSRPTATTDDVTYRAWTCPAPSARHVTCSDVTPTTWYGATDAAGFMDDVVGSASSGPRQLSLPTLASQRLAAAAASLTGLPSPTCSILPALTDNASGRTTPHLSTACPASAANMGQRSM